tara:strand:- start:1865 stop:2272 length:408 start_codon:yes stop_codon:yes gene_type:complete
MKNKSKLDEIKNNFMLFTDPMEIISQLVDIGKKAHNLNEEQKNTDNIIDGCTSKAWLVISQLDKNCYAIKTDSDSHIVSGLLYLLSLAIDNESKEFIDKLDPIMILNLVGLDGHISSQRTNGFISAVETLKKRII